MRQTKLATLEFIGPFGMRCPYCTRVIEPGDEVVVQLDGMIGDTPVVVSGICPSCADLIEKHGMKGCEACVGTGEWGHGYGERLVQCSTCHGMGEVIASVVDEEQEGGS